MKQETLEFLKRWLAWVDDGAPEGDPFHRDLGLCCSAVDVDGEIHKDLKAGFRADRLYGLYPFGGRNAFVQDVRKSSMHLNEQRVAWVRSKVNA